MERWENLQRDWCLFVNYYMSTAMLDPSHGGYERVGSKEQCPATPSEAGLQEWHVVCGQDREKIPLHTERSSQASHATNTAPHGGAD